MISSSRRPATTADARSPAQNPGVLRRLSLKLGRRPPRPALWRNSSISSSDDSAGPATPEAIEFALPPAAKEDDPFGPLYAPGDVVQRSPSLLRRAARAMKTRAVSAPPSPRPTSRLSPVFPAELARADDRRPWSPLIGAGGDPSRLVRAPSRRTMQAPHNNTAHELDRAAAVALVQWHHSVVRHSSAPATQFDGDFARRLAHDKLWRATELRHAIGHLALCRRLQYGRLSRGEAAELAGLAPTCIDVGRPSPMRALDGCHPTSPAPAGQDVAAFARYIERARALVDRAPFCDRCEIATAIDPPASVHPMRRRPSQTDAALRGRLPTYGPAIVSAHLVALLRAMPSPQLSPPPGLQRSPDVHSSPTTSASPSTLGRRTSLRFSPSPDLPPGCRSPATTSRVR